MKRFGFISTAVLLLFLGMTGSVFAQQQDERDKPPAHEDQAAPPQENRDAKPVQQDEKPMQQDDKKAQDLQKKDDKQAQDQEKQQQKDEKRAQQEDKNNPQAKNAHAAANNNGGGRIPVDKFRAHFGSAHHFRISHPTIVSGQPRFQYSGYWFVIATPWPVGWDYADDCYIDYVDGEYLLFDLAHPGASIVVSVVL